MSNTERDHNTIFPNLLTSYIVYGNYKEPNSNLTTIGNKMKNSDHNAHTILLQ